MSQEHCSETDREFVQFSHRRVAWLALMRYDRTLRDADHTLALMDFVAAHGIDESYVASHERFRGLVLFHRNQAAAAMALERRRPEEAIDVVREGIAQLARHQDEWFTDRDRDESPNQTLIEQLLVLEQEIRKNFGVNKTLREQLDEAVVSEDYERAARLRDQIRHRAEARSPRFPLHRPPRPPARVGSVPRHRPVDDVGGEDRSLHADAPQVDVAVGLSKGRDATEARAEPASHVVFQREVARNRMPLHETAQRGQHGGGAAADNPGRPFPAFNPGGQQLGDDPEGRAVVGRLNGDPTARKSSTPAASAAVRTP